MKHNIKQQLISNKIISVDTYSYNLYKKIKQTRDQQSKKKKNKKNKKKKLRILQQVLLKENYIKEKKTTATEQNKPIIQLFIKIKPMNEEQSANLKQANSISNQQQQECNSLPVQKQITQQNNQNQRQDEIQPSQNSEKTFYLHKLKKKINLNIAIPTQQKNEDYAELTNGTILNIMLDKEIVKNLDQQNAQNKDNTDKNQNKNNEASQKNGDTQCQGNQMNNVQNENSGNQSSNQQINGQQLVKLNSGNINNKQKQPMIKPVGSQNNLKNLNVTNKSQEEQPKENNTNKDNNAADQHNSYIEINGVRIQISELRRVKVLGHGSSGLVEKAIHDSTGIIIGIKSIPLLMNQSFRKQLDQELKTLIQCESDSIIKCYGAYIQKCMINITLEYMDLGTVHDLYKKVGPLPEIIVAIMAIQVLKGLHFIHNKVKVIHRDIKPSNLLVNSKGQVKIADFGVSANLESAVEAKNWVGTVTYMSPERFRGQAYTANTDIWSLGLTICECALGTYPYFDTNQYEKKENLSFWELLEYFNMKPAPRLPDNYSEEMKDFVSKCFKKSPLDRPNSEELLNHEMVKKFSKYDSSYFEEWINKNNLKPVEEKHELIVQSTPQISSQNPSTSQIPSLILQNENIKSNIPQNLNQQPLRKGSIFLQQQLNQQQQQQLQQQQLLQQQSVQPLLVQQQQVLQQQQFIQQQSSQLQQAQQQQNNTPPPISNQNSNSRESPSIPTFRPNQDQDNQEEQFVEEPNEFYDQNDNTLKMKNVVHQRVSYIPEKFGPINIPGSRKQSQIISSNLSEVLNNQSDQFDQTNSPLEAFPSQQRAKLLNTKNLSNLNINVINQDSQKRVMAQNTPNQTSILNQNSIQKFNIGGHNSSASISLAQRSNNTPRTSVQYTHMQMQNLIQGQDKMSSSQGMSIAQALSPKSQLISQKALPSHGSEQIQNMMQQQHFFNSNGITSSNPSIYLQQQHMIQQQEFQLSIQKLEQISGGLPVQGSTPKLINPINSAGNQAASYQQLNSQQGLQNQMSDQVIGSGNLNSLQRIQQSEYLQKSNSLGAQQINQQTNFRQMYQQNGQLVQNQFQQQYIQNQQSQQGFLQQQLQSGYIQNNQINNTDQNIQQSQQPIGNIQQGQFNNQNMIQQPPYQSMFNKVNQQQIQLNHQLQNMNGQQQSQQLINNHPSVRHIIQAEEIQTEITKKIEEGHTKLKQFVTNDLQQKLIDNLLLSLQVKVKQKILDQLPSLIEKEFQIEFESLINNINNSMMIQQAQAQQQQQQQQQPPAQINQVQTLPFQFPSQNSQHHYANLVHPQPIHPPQQNLNNQIAGQTSVQSSNGKQNNGEQVNTSVQTQINNSQIRLPNSVIQDKNTVTQTSTPLSYKSGSPKLNSSPLVMNALQNKSTLNQKNNETQIQTQAQTINQNPDQKTVNNGNQIIANQNQNNTTAEELTSQNAVQRELFNNQAPNTIQVQGRQLEGSPRIQNMSRNLIYSQTPKQEIFHRERTKQFSQVQTNTTLLQYTQKSGNQSQNNINSKMSNSVQLSQFNKNLNISEDPHKLTDFALSKAIQKQLVDQKSSTNQPSSTLNKLQQMSISLKDTNYDQAQQEMINQLIESNVSAQAILVQTPSSTPPPSQIQSQQILNSTSTNIIHKSKFQHSNSFNPDSSNGQQNNVQNQTDDVLDIELTTSSNTNNQNDLSPVNDNMTSSCNFSKISMNPIQQETTQLQANTATSIQQIGSQINTSSNANINLAGLPKKLARDSILINNPQQQAELLQAIQQQSQAAPSQSLQQITNQKVAAQPLQPNTAGNLPEEQEQNKKKQSLIDNQKNFINLQEQNNQRKN